MTSRSSCAAARDCLPARAARSAPRTVRSSCPCCLAALLPCCLVALLPCCLVALLPCCLVALAPGHLGEPVGAGLDREGRDGSRWRPVAGQRRRTGPAVSGLMRLGILWVGDLFPVQGANIGQPSLLKTDPEGGADAVADIGDHDGCLQLPVGERVEQAERETPVLRVGDIIGGLPPCGIGPAGPSTRAADTTASATRMRQCRCRRGR